MSARPRTVHAGPVHARLLASCASATATVVLLAACGSAGTDAGSPSSGGSTTSSTFPSPTAATTATDGLTPSPAPTSPDRPNTTMTIPPPSGDSPPIPTDARAYAQDFVQAWATRDRARGELLGTPQATKEAFAATPAGVPTLEACEAATASASCTFTGDGLTIVVRVRTATASAGEPDAVTAVAFRH